VSNIYSKSVVTASPALLAQTRAIICDRFLRVLESTFSREKPGVLNIYALLSATTMDIVTGYIFGLKASSDLVQDTAQLAWFLDLYNSRRSFNFWPQELPGFTNFLEKWFGYRLVPRWVDAANGEIEKWTMDMCESAGMVLSSDVIDVADTPVVYQHLSKTLAKEVQKAGDEKGDLRHVLASEVLDHLAAGFDTSGITLVYVVHELSRNREMQVRLREELHTLSSQVNASCSTLPDPKTVDALPLLHAIVWETLRLHPAIPGPQPRVTPPQGCRLGTDDKTYYVPGGVRVSASAGLLHKNEDVYDRADEWRPDRWLNLEKVDDEKRKDMESRWFWAFGRLVESFGS
jgi:cytochrome P450